MKSWKLLSLFFVDCDGKENYGLASATGKYRFGAKEKEQDAHLIIFLCPTSKDNIFSFYYVDSTGKYLKHSPLHLGEDSVDYVLLEAWMRFNVLPHYWILAEEVDRQLTIKEYPSEYQEIYTRLREVVSRFRWAEISKVATYGKSERLSKEELAKYESERIFYPNIPQQTPTPLTL